ncbi:MAG: hypothetical protein ABIW82_16830 [Dokdonella sp.]
MNAHSSAIEVIRGVAQRAGRPLSARHFKPHLAGGSDMPAVVGYLRTMVDTGELVVVPTDGPNTLYALPAEDTSEESASAKTFTPQTGAGPSLPPIQNNNGFARLTMPLLERMQTTSDWLSIDQVRERFCPFEERSRVAGTLANLVNALKIERRGFRTGVEFRAMAAADAALAAEAQPRAGFLAGDQTANMLSTAQGSTIAAADGGVVERELMEYLIQATARADAALRLRALASQDPTLRRLAGMAQRLREEIAVVAPLCTVPQSDESAVAAGRPSSGGSR